MIKVCCISDIHGNLIDIPRCDILLIAGDILPLSFQRNNQASAHWINTRFNQWAKSISNLGTRIYVIAGNHDFVFQNGSMLIQLNNHWTYLQDQLIIDEKSKLKIYGTPWQPTFYNWAFNLDEEDLKRKWSIIPECDIIVVHGPPNGYGDLTKEGLNVGSYSLRIRILELCPKLVVCGHIHESYGIYQLNQTQIINASIVNHDYLLKNKPIIIEL